MAHDSIPPLTARVNDRSMTEAGEVGCVMYPHAHSVKTEDSYIFNYRPGHLSDLHTIEWASDTMSVVVPPGWVEYLLREGYARLMTADEADAYNDYIKGAKP